MLKLVKLHDTLFFQSFDVSATFCSVQLLFANEGTAARANPNISKHIVLRMVLVLDAGSNTALKNILKYYYFRRH